MDDVLLNYVMRVTQVAPIPAPSTEYLHNVLVIVPQKTAETPKTVVKITTQSDLSAITDATAPMSLKDGGLTSFYALPLADLDMSVAGGITGLDDLEVFTILIDPKFGDDALESLKLPDGYRGIVGGASNDDALVEERNKMENNSFFYQTANAEGNNMYQAFGSLLNPANTLWSSQQFISMPQSDNVNTYESADDLFNLRANFVLTSKEFGNRLAFFCVGGKNNKAIAIHAPYVTEELVLQLQGAALSWINLNKPDYTTAEAVLLQDHLQGIADEYTATGQIGEIQITVSLGSNDFVMEADITAPLPKATWRLNSILTQGE